MDKYYVKNGINRVTEKYPSGCVTGTLYKNSKGIKYKTLSVGIHGVKEAYDIVEIWAHEMAKKHNCETRLLSLEEIKKRLEQPSGSRVAKYHKGMGKTGRKMTIIDLSDAKRLIESITQQYENLGHKKIKEVLDSAFKHLDKMKRDSVVINDGLQNAKIEMANAFVKIYRETKVDMSSQIADTDVLRIYKLKIKSL